MLTGHRKKKERVKKLIKEGYLGKKKERREEEGRR